MIRTRKYTGKYEKVEGFPLIFKEHDLAHKYLDGKKGLEIGAAAHNPFGLDSQNVDISKFDEEYGKEYRRMQASMCGEYAMVDIDAWANDLPVENESQDYVISSHVLEHIWDPLGALMEWWRVTKDGGYIFIIVPRADALEEDAARGVTSILELDERYLEPELPDGKLPGGHHTVFDLNLLDEMVDYLNDDFNQDLFVPVEWEETDTKVGNGQTAVFKVNKSFEDLEEDDASD